MTPEPRSPAGRAAWVGPVLAALTLIAGVGYAWSATGNLEVYYAAAVRSMSMSWHNFFSAAFDPAATISLDKLPGAFWVQALSVRLFGVHAWALVAPQVIEGMASVVCTTSCAGCRVRWPGSSPPGRSCSARPRSRWAAETSPTR
jgi:4-amino-4-deoxy-L-arabinose transferase-like glycosyltransferase